ncbi:MAG TPA: hypothetical protein PKW99_07275, partial [Thauera sp.]|nr:hypothetical protein [Thauera sp.]
IAAAAHCGVEHHANDEQERDTESQQLAPSAVRGTFNLADMLQVHVTCPKNNKDNIVSEN